jgi:hypothetical protein
MSFKNPESGSAGWLRFSFAGGKQEKSRKSRSPTLRNVSFLLPTRTPKQMHNAAAALTSALPDNHSGSATHAMPHRTALHGRIKLFWLFRSLSSLLCAGQQTLRDHPHS